MKKAAFVMIFLFLFLCLSPLFVSAANDGLGKTSVLSLTSSADKTEETSDLTENAGEQEKSPLSIVFSVIFVIAVAAAVFFIRRPRKRFPR